MNEHQVGYRVRQWLNQDGNIDPVILARLEVARELAMAKQRVTAPSLVSHISNNVLGVSDRPRSIWVRLLLPSVILIFGIMAMQSWRQVQLAEEIEEIDAAVLTGDLPIDAYTDAGFDTWLKRSLQ